MKTKFSKEYLLDNKGCYNKEQVESLDFDSNNEITLERIFETIPIKDFTWFVSHKIDLTLLQTQLFALSVANFVLPIYEKRYPGDKRVRDCNETTKLYIEGSATIEELREKRAYADAAAASAADDVYAAAYAAATCAAYAASASAVYTTYDASVYVSSSAAAATCVASADAYKEHVRIFIFETLSNNPVK